MGCERRYHLEQPYLVWHAGLGLVAVGVGKEYAGRIVYVLK